MVWGPCGWWPASTTARSSRRSRNGRRPKNPCGKSASNIGKRLADLGLKSGDHLQYWATAEDRNPGTPEQPGPGRAQSRVFHLSVVSPQQAEQILNQQINDYSKAIAELIKLQRQNRGETATQLPARGLVERQGMIVRQTGRIADVMQQASFPATSIIDELRDLAADPMAKVLAALEGYRDAADPPAGQKLADASLPIQDEILRRLEALQLRLDRDEQTQRALKKLEKEDPQAAKLVNTKLEKLAKDLDSFLADMKDLEDKYERMPKRDQPEAKAEDAAALADAEHRLDRWKKWAKGTIDDLTKLPHDLGTHSGLTENLTAIFEEIEKKPRGPTQEMATAAPDNGKATAETVLEDLELWNSDKGDSSRWAMEDHPEGRNQAIDTPDSRKPARRHRRPDRRHRRIRQRSRRRHRHFVRQRPGRLGHRRRADQLLRGPRQDRQSTAQRIGTRRPLRIGPPRQKHRQIGRRREQRPRRTPHPGPHDQRTIRRREHQVEKTARCPWIDRRRQEDRRRRAWIARRHASRLCPRFRAARKAAKADARKDTASGQNHPGHRPRARRASSGRSN